MIRISVVICTYNRAHILRRALESLVQQTFDKSLYEIIVVDNASTDASPSIVRDLQVEYPAHNIVLVREDTLGLSYARNTGLRHAKAPYVAFMDDDAKASAEWLETAIQCFEEMYPKPIAIGGTILPLYEAAKPRWFKDKYEVITWGEQPRFLKHGEAFSGSNMVFDKEAFRVYGLFDVSMGPKGKYFSLGEDTNIFQQIWKANANASILYYIPQLLVYHSVPAHKMTVLYRLKRRFLSGQSRYQMNRPKSLLGRVKLLIKILISITMLSGLAIKHWRKLFTFQNWIVEDLGPIASKIGHLIECLGFTVQMRQK